MAKAREIVLRHGWNAVAYQILNPGFQLWFSKTHDAVAGYVQCAGRWVIAGAPVCDKAVLSAVIKELEQAANSAGCKTCYFGAANRLYEDCIKHPGHSTVLLGAQPTWNPADWPGMIAAHSSVRAQLRRARNKGIIISDLPHPTPADYRELRTVLNAWIKSRKMPPMHFLVEPDIIHQSSDRQIFIARQSTSILGFLVASPIPARNGWLIEQIIRHPSAPNGTTELLLNHAIEHLSQNGSQYITLGLAPLSQPGFQNTPPNPFWLKALFACIKAHGQRFYDFKGLEAFKSKFQPSQWEPIYAISTEPAFSPRTLWAIAAAFSHNQSPITHGTKTLAMAAKQEISKLQHKSKANPATS